MARELSQPKIVTVEPITHSQPASLNLNREPDGRWTGYTSVEQGRMVDEKFVADPQFRKDYNATGLNLSGPMSAEDISDAIVTAHEKLEAVAKEVREAREKADRLERDSRAQ